MEEDMSSLQSRVRCVIAGYKKRRGRKDGGVFA